MLSTMMQTERSERSELNKIMTSREIGIQLLRETFKEIESGVPGDYQAVGDNGKAYGAYQFHQARWDEVMPNYNRLTAGKPIQDLAMTRSLEILIRKHPKITLVEIANYHNKGHISTIKTKYTQKFVRIYIRKVNDYRRNAIKSSSSGYAGTPSKVPAKAPQNRRFTYSALSIPFGL